MSDSQEENSVFPDKLKIQKMFPTPKNFKEIEEWIDQSNKADGTHGLIMYATMMTYNLLATSMNELADEYNRVLEELNSYKAKYDK